MILVLPACSDRAFVCRAINALIRNVIKFSYYMGLHGLRGLEFRELPIPFQGGGAYTITIPEVLDNDIGSYPVFYNIPQETCESRSALGSQFHSC